MKKSTYTQLILTSVLATLLFTSCENEPAEETAHSSSDHGWSYYGETGPEHWGSLSEEYSVAYTGTEQSPINIQTAECETSHSLPAISYAYDSASISVINNGHTVQGNLTSDDNHITIGTARYNLAQFHFHTLSENTVNGAFAPIEMHMVHKSDAGELAVVGVFFEEGAENSTLSEIWSNLPVHADEHYEAHEKVAIKELIPSNRSAYRFDGSLTTPPCTEGVKWTVMANNLEMSADQITSFKNIFSGHEFPEGNRRPVQPVNHRVIVLDQQ